MPAPDPADSPKAAIIRWLWQQRTALDPARVVDQDGRVERPRKDRALDELAAEMTDDLLD